MDAAVIRTLRAGAGWASRRTRVLVPMAALAVAAVALAVMLQLLRTVRLADIEAAMTATPAWRIGAAVALTIASYLALTLYDWFALQTIGRPMPWRTAAFASFTSYTLSHNLGFSLLTGGSARLRAYSAAGLGFSDVARVTLLASGNFWAGIIALAGAALALSPRHALHHLALGAHVGRIAGVLMLSAVLLPVILRSCGLKEIGWGRLTVPLPGPATMGAQLLVSTLDLLCASAALYVLVPQAGSAGFGVFFLAYALAVIAGLLTHVPGGLGVFEATVMSVVPGHPQAIFAALLLYRLIYYLLPLAAAGALTIGIEHRRLAAPLLAGRAVVSGIARTVAPTFAALAVFGGGLVLLLSGALPPIFRRIQVLRDLLPLSIVEAAHVAASVTGIFLILIAPALQSRLKSGFLLARWLLITGALLSLLKGFDFEEASLMLVVVGLLQLGQSAFYRRGGLAGAPLSDWWWAAALGALVLSIWAGFLAYRHVPYSNELWTVFDWRRAAPRFLRAATGASLFVIGFSMWRLTSAPAVDAGGAALPPEVADKGFAVAERADAMLALTGDKCFLASRSGDAFLMYRLYGRSWIVMGDPVGPRRDWPELAWAARQACDRLRARLCFYQASADMLPILIELGLRPIKYGEEALIDLRDGFSLEGGARKSLRYSTRRAAAAGLSFGIIPAAEVPANLDALRFVSDSWLAGKKKEKCFSLGRFDPAYISRFDCAVLRSGERIVAFANIWKAPNRREISVDLMRHLPDTPYGAMDLLFVSLMQWAAARGFARFNLGLAPLSGLADSPLAPLWSRAGATLFEHGERFYGFSGLRAFKQKYGPDWVPRYIATPDGIAGWRTLIDVAALVGG